MEFINNQKTYFCISLMVVCNFDNGLPVCFDFLRTFITISRTCHGKACRKGLFFITLM